MIELLESWPVSAAIFITGLLSALVIVRSVTKYHAIAITNFELSLVLTLVAGYLSFDLLLILNELEGVTVSYEVFIVVSRITRLLFFALMLFISIRGSRRQESARNEDWKSLTGDSS